MQSLFCKLALLMHSVLLQLLDLMPLAPLKPPEHREVRVSASQEPVLAGRLRARHALEAAKQCWAPLQGSSWGDTEPQGCCSQEAKAGGSPVGPPTQSRSCDSSLALKTSTKLLP